MSHGTWTMRPYETIIFHSILKSFGNGLGLGVLGGRLPRREMAM